MDKILVNKVRCKKCGDVIESKSTHDFQSCECGAIFIDGGKEYQRYGWGTDRNKFIKSEGDEIEDYIDFSFSVYEDKKSSAD